MNPDTEIALPPEPTAVDYRGLLARFNNAIRAYNSGEIDFSAFRRHVARIEDETRVLNFLRKLHSTHRGIAAREQKRAKSPVSP